MSSFPCLARFVSGSGQALARTMLEAAGFTVAEAATGAQATQAARTVPPRLVLLDIQPLRDDCVWTPPRRLSWQARLQLDEPAGRVVHLLDSQAEPVPETAKPFAAGPGDRLFQLALLDVFSLDVFGRGGGCGHHRFLGRPGP